MSRDIHWNALAPVTRQTLDFLARLPIPPGFYLAGGTALALQIGHRISYDLDFFSATNPLGMSERAALARQVQRFEDAENDPRELHLLHKIRWSAVKKYCTDGARLLSKLSAGLEPPE